MQVLSHEVHFHFFDPNKFPELNKEISLRQLLYYYMKIAIKFHEENQLTIFAFAKCTITVLAILPHEALVGSYEYFYPASSWDSINTNFPHY